MTDAVHDHGPAPAAPSAKVRPLYWSVRRELWEHPAILVAPLAVAGVVLFGFLLSAADLTEKTRRGLPVTSREALSTPYGFLAMALIVTGFVVGAFYCLAALHGERRDRSVLFWKSLPVSDLRTVASKAMVPLVVLPAVILAITAAAQTVMMAVSSMIVLAGGGDVQALWRAVPLVGLWATLLYGLVTNALWHAPIYAWLLLVSGWARRTPILWALGPPVALCLVEAVAFRASAVRSLLQHRLVGGPAEAFAGTASDGPGLLPHIAPLKFLGSPNLWLGLLFAAVCLAIAVRQRRRCEPT